MAGIKTTVKKLGALAAAPTGAAALTIILLRKYASGPLQQNAGLVALGVGTVLAGGLAALKRRGIGGLLAAGLPVLAVAIPTIVEEKALLGAFQTTARRALGGRFQTTQRGMRGVPVIEAFGRVVGTEGAPNAPPRRLMAESSGVSLNAFGGAAFGAGY